MIQKVVSQMVPSFIHETLVPIITNLFPCGVCTLIERQVYKQTTVVYTICNKFSVQLEPRAGGAMLDG